MVGFPVFRFINDYIVGVRSQESGVRSQESGVRSQEKELILMELPSNYSQNRYFY
ncbi:MAG: hypothetical protein ACKPE3_13310 [Sphaerospermopsis kisseleviana]